MKQMILGVVWQILGFLGSLVIVCTAAPHSWNYNGITGLLGSLLGLDLVMPLVICFALFVVGVALCYKALREK